MTTRHGLPAADTSAWRKIDPRVSAALLAEAERLHVGPAIMPSANEWMQYRLTGNRADYENRMTALHDRLSASVLAACLARDGDEQERWSLIAADDAWVLCELTSWCLPAHYTSGSRNRTRELPDPSDPVLDHDAAVIGALLAWTANLLAPFWRESHPSLLLRVHEEIRLRVLAPFIDKSHHWFGSPEAPPNNWAPWITANALACFLVVGSAREQDAAVRVAVPVLANFCAGYGSDGACEEGATYWWVAALTLFEALDFIRILTDGRVDKLGSPLLAAMGKYPHQMQVGGSWQVNFGDASPRLDTTGRFHAALRYATAVGDDAAALFARSMGALAGQRDPEKWTLPARAARHFHRLALELLDPEWMTPGSGSAASPPYPAATFLPSTGVLCARQFPGRTAGLFLAVKGGDNGVSHNHNDAGSFTVFADGLPVIIDIGVETYGKETFEAANRYEIWAMRSSHHNVPMINGREQRPGHQYGATKLESWGLDDGVAERTGLSMNIERAYGDVDGLDGWRRSVELDRTVGCVLVRDSWQGSTVSPEIVLMLAAEPHTVSPSSFAVGGAVITHSLG